MTSEISLLYLQNVKGNCILSYLETSVVPICRFNEGNGQALIKSFHGTAFFINSSGGFITARHVIEEGLQDVERNGGFLGLCAKPEDGSIGNIALPIQEFEFAESPFDITVGKAKYQCESYLQLSDIEVSMWREIATLGYPESALNIKPDDFRIHLRGYKGYLLREIQKGDIALGEHPSSFETNFLISRGLSGSPLFVPAQPKCFVIGVCVGSHRSELVDYQFVETTEDGKEFKETRLRVEEYGIAHDIRPLLSWKLNMYNGKTLKEIS
ncbi:hypothetical protein BH10ACI1_BH10ACI1_03310 [soil metagenome]